MAKSNKKVVKAIYLDEELYKKFKIYTIEKGTSVSFEVNEFLKSKVGNNNVASKKNKA